MVFINSETIIAECLKITSQGGGLGRNSGKGQ